jgi:hypothetical protein
MQSGSRRLQMRVAFSSIAWNTGSSSPGDELMMRKTSDIRETALGSRPVQEPSTASLAEMFAFKFPDD